MFKNTLIRFYLNALSFKLKRPVILIKTTRYYF